MLVSERPVAFDFVLIQFHFAVQSIAFVAGNQKNEIISTAFECN